MKYVKYYTTIKILDKQVVSSSPLFLLSSSESEDLCSMCWVGGRSPAPLSADVERGPTERLRPGTQRRTWAPASRISDFTELTFPHTRTLSSITGPKYQHQHISRHNSSEQPGSV